MVHFCDGIQDNYFSHNYFSLINSHLQEFAYQTQSASQRTLLDVIYRKMIGKGRMQSNINISVMDALHMLSKIWMIHAISRNRLVIHVQYKIMLNHNVLNETFLINASNAGLDLRTQRQ